MSEDENFRRATRRLLFKEQSPQNIPGAGRSAAEMPEKHVRIKVTMNVDGDVVQYFKELAQREGRAYQSLINQVLREFIEGSRPEKLAEDVKKQLLQDEKFLEQLRDRLTRSIK